MHAKIPAILVAIVTLAIASAPPLTTGFGRFTTGQFRVPQVNPAVKLVGYAFSILGVIYFRLTVGARYGLFLAAEDTHWRAMHAPLTAALTIGAFWIAVANAEPVSAASMIVAMAALAITGMVRAGYSNPLMQARQVALYGRRLTAAVGIAFGVTLIRCGVTSAQSATIFCLIGVLAVGLSIHSVRPAEESCPAAIIWALIGGFAANLPGPNWPAIALAVLAITTLGLSAAQSVKRKVSR